MGAFMHRPRLILIVKSGRFDQQYSREAPKELLEMACETLKLRSYGETIHIFYPPYKAFQKTIEIVVEVIPKIVCHQHQELGGNFVRNLILDTNEAFEFFLAKLEETKPNIVIVVPDTSFMSGFQHLCAKHFLERYEKPFSGIDGLSTLIDTARETFEKASLLPTPPQ